MGLKRKVARYIKIIWVSTKSETVFLYSACVERCSKTIKSWRRRKRRKGKKIFFRFQTVRNLVCFIQGRFGNLSLASLLHFIFVEVYSQETCDNPVWGTRLRLLCWFYRPGGAQGPEVTHLQPKDELASELES